MQTGVGRVVGMRPEDRKPAKRVFPLLQNLDLDSVTFSQVQSVGEPISIEDMNEQEMLDLIIVNLARLCCAGEWTGLLEAGGGIGIELMPQQTYYSAYTWDTSRAAPYGTAAKETGTFFRDITFFPFIAPNSGDLSSISVKCTSAASDGTTTIGIFADTDGVPSTMLGTADFDTTSTGEIEQTSLSDTITTVRGTQYWTAQTHSTTNYPTMTTATRSGQVGRAPGAIGTTGITSTRQYGVTTMATVTDLTDLIFSAVPQICVGLKWA